MAYHEELKDEDFLKTQYRSPRYKRKGARVADHIGFLNTLLKSLVVFIFQI